MFFITYQNQLCGVSLPSVSIDYSKKSNQTNVIRAYYGAQCVFNTRVKKRDIEGFLIA